MNIREELSDDTEAVLIKLIYTNNFTFEFWSTVNGFHVRTNLGKLVKVEWDPVTFTEPVVLNECDLLTVLKLDQRSVGELRKQHTFHCNFPFVPLLSHDLRVPT